MNEMIIKYADLCLMPVINRADPLVPVNYFDKSIIFKYEWLNRPQDMEEVILVRKLVAKKLSRINCKLNKIDSSLVLKVTYGFRPMYKQKELFEKVCKQIISSGKQFKSKLEFLEEVHKYIAVPFVAGHPTGGAVDVTIFDIKNKQNLDMGSTISDLDEKKLVDWDLDEVSKEQRENRKLLKGLMLGENFASFWAEWWHYSFGDREWAVYYGKKNAIYESFN